MFERRVEDGEAVELDDASHFQDDPDAQTGTPGKRLSYDEQAPLWTDEGRQTSRSRPPKGRSGRRLALFALVFALFLAIWAGWSNLKPVNSGDEAFKWALDDFSHDGQMVLPPGYAISNVSQACHSHNDYWRKVPLFEALYYGCVGVEADVWLQDDGELFVGHEEKVLTPDRTFLSLYVNPIAKLLDNFQDREQRRHMFPQEPNTELVLLVDLKTDGHKTFAVVQKQLEYLRNKDYLTSWTSDGDAIHKASVRVVMTGNTLFDEVVKNETYRDMFFDAPLARIYDDAQDNAPAHAAAPREDGQGLSGIGGITNASEFKPSNSFYASTDFYEVFGWKPFVFGLSSKQKVIMSEQIATAHAQGLTDRYWGGPSWPWFVRNAVWKDMKKLGSMMINADDLKAVTSNSWRPLNSSMTSL